MRLVRASAVAWIVGTSVALFAMQQPPPAGQSPAPSERPPRPATDPATPGERTSPPAENPQRPATPAPAAPQQTGGAAPLVSNPYPSTYKPLPSQTTVIRNATILTAAGPVIERGSLLMQGGKIAAVGQSVTAPADARVIDAAGKWVTPGIIDTHSHLGVYPAPGIAAVEDGNEMTSPNTAEVWAEHSIWPQDPQFDLALAGRRHDHADPARVGESVRRPRRDGQERAVADGAGDEVSRALPTA